MKRPIAVIGGSGVKSILKGNQKILGTPYGPTPSLTIGEVDSRPAVFLPRHGENHSSPPHKVNYRANIWLFSPQMFDSRPAVFLPRHGENHSSPPHKVNYRANIWWLK